MWGRSGNKGRTQGVNKLETATSAQSLKWKIKLENWKEVGPRNFNRKRKDHGDRWVGG